MIKQKISIILNEIKASLKNVNEDEVEKIINKIIKSKRVIVIGAGRMGLIAKAFSMRLMHLGLQSYTLSDSNLPLITKEDLLIVCSGSGETQTIYDLVIIAKNQRCKVILITNNPESRIGKISDDIVIIKIKENPYFISKQPMKTLTEQSLLVLFDGIVLLLMEKLRINDEYMKLKHSILE